MYKLTHNVTGEVVYVEALGGMDLEVWTAEEDLDYHLREAKARLWERAKQVRDALEDGVAPTPLGAVQCDDRSKLKISGLVQMAQIAAAQGQPFEEPFTLADNSVAVLDASTAVSLGVAVGQYVSSVHAHARGLRAAIDAAETFEALGAIDVEANWP